MNEVLGSLFTLLLIGGAFWIMVRPAFGRMRRSDGYGVRRSDYLARWSHSLVFVVLIPVLTWALGIIGRSYQRSFVVFTEFVSGVHDWPTYRTSMYKYAGMLFGFLAFNLVFIAIAQLSWSLPARLLECRNGSR